MLKFMELIMPEEFRPEINQKPRRSDDKQSGENGEELDRNFLFPKFTKEKSCRQRALSIIKEEAEGYDE